MFPYAAALAYARLLVEQADALAQTYGEVGIAAALALEGWKGRFATEMVQTRLPEQHADMAAIATPAMRREAEAWADAWAEAVNDHNRRQYLQANDEHDSQQRLANATSAVVPTMPPRPPEGPRLAMAPSPDGFVPPPSFVRYHFAPGGLAHAGGWSANYSLDPGSVGG